MRGDCPRARHGEAVLRHGRELSSMIVSNIASLSPKPALKAGLPND